MIDLIAVLPFYVAWGMKEYSRSVGGGDGDTKMAAAPVLRMLRLVRLGKLFKYHEGGAMVGEVLLQSSTVLQLMMFLMGIFMVLIASLLFFVESNGPQDSEGYFLRPAKDGDGGMEVSPFQSIPDAFWITIVTFTTVGYGDVTPSTFPGKVVMTAAMLFGVLVMALPIGVISTNFNAEFLKNQDARRRRLEAMAKKSMKAALKSYRRETRRKMAEAKSAGKCE